MNAPVKIFASLSLRSDVLRRAKEMLRGAPDRVAAHRVSVGINEQEASAAPVKVSKRKIKTDRVKTNYKGNPSGVFLIDVALAHEFGTKTLPERSWLRSWFDQNIDRLKRECVAAMRAEYNGDKDAVPALANKWQAEMRGWIVDAEAKLQPLTDRTMREREAAGLPPGPPLYATHQLVEAIRSIADGAVRMIDWATIKTTAESLVRDLMKPIVVKWRDEPSGGVWSNEPVIYLRINALDSIGIDEERRANVVNQAGDVTDDDQIVNVVSQKRFTLSLRCETFDQDIAGKNGGAILETLRTRLGRASSIERLTDIFSIADDTAAKWIGYVDDSDRQVSVYVMDLFCLTVDNDTDESDEAGSFIDEIIISGNVQDGTRTIPVNLDVKGD